MSRATNMLKQLEMICQQRNYERDEVVMTQFVKALEALGQRRKAMEIYEMYRP